MKKLIPIVLSAFVFVACDDVNDDDFTTETEIETGNAVENTGEALEDAGENTADALEDAGDSAQENLEEAGEKLDRSVDVDIED